MARTQLGERLLDSVGVSRADAVLVVAESDSRWTQVAPSVRSKDLAIVSTQRKFSRAELTAAAWLQLSPWPLGYPQPEDNFDYLENTYDEVCRSCGGVGRQRSPFRMAGEPRWGTRSIMTLNWVFDAVFVKPEVFHGVFEPLGFRSRKVENRRGSTLTSVVQVEIPERVSLDMGTSKGRVCRTCGRRRFSPDKSAELPPLRTIPRSDMAQSDERFGAGLVYFAVTIVSARLYRALQAAKVKGAELSVLTVADGGK